ncbi:hypothetical protein [Nitrospira moscoviensis]|uniref:Uncharacterized protein n=1 Tax=Nitrospira moscoviensis TaxID=42253 RepID=A0A0K2GGK3_NITMO|nr:hypothetical protein [Nitrospira moscoviensis]ALA59752.1 hypothetical protein NITMOv2_3360 [Nitrospira moscoviensis]
MDARQKTLLAVGLGVTWIGLTWWQWGTFQEPARVPLTNVSGLPPSGQGAGVKAGGLRVNLALLASARTQREATFTAPRNIFAVPQPDGTLPMGMNASAAVPIEPVSEETVAQQAAAVELAQYKYLGFLRMSEGRNRNKDVAVLSKNEEVVVVKVGDRVEDHLVLKAITPESVTIRDTGARIEQTLPLSEEPAPQP